ncbi:hypothetical protein [Saccharopolyspora sp. 6V]|uniref:hypothetical protein n=1 Tax=Saccharopolyspora sp. 6V TaxID=2877239 RepID=UPI001CD76561|nr:hypothetical protein [Saccharopolyspora sp. 6V]MCA1196169.1 hypothetical protein [Saccharopolyspora sp. 6V]
MWPFDDIGDSLGSEIAEFAADAFESAMRALWDGSLDLLRESFDLADRFSVFEVNPHDGPVGVLWPMMLWISGVLALGLFSWQLIMTSLRGGRGMVRLTTGPLQYGVALAITVGMVGTFLAASDGLTQGILRAGLQSANFHEALESTEFAGGTGEGIKAVVLGLCAVIGVLPAAVGYLLEMLFREAAIYLLVATIPITAAGLLANVTKRWFWTTVRWLLSCIAMKPVLALALVLGVGLVAGAEGLSALLAGIGVLVLSVFSPLVLFRLFAFVDPNTDAGGVFRDALSSSTGIDSYGMNNPVAKAATSLAGAGDSGSADSAQEDAATGRFDAAVADVGDRDGDAGGSSGSGSADQPLDPDAARPEQDEDAPGGADTDEVRPPAANRGSVTSDDGIGPQFTGGGGDDTRPPEPGGGSDEPPVPSGGGDSRPPEPPVPGSDGAESRPPDPPVPHGGGDGSRPPDPPVPHGGGDESRPPDSATPLGEGDEARPPEPSALHGDRTEPSPPEPSVPGGDGEPPDTRSRGGGPGRDGGDGAGGDLDEGLNT